MGEFDLWAQLPSVLPEVGLTALAVIVLFADIYGSIATRRNVVFVSAVGMALLALAPLIWVPDPAQFENGVLLWGGMVNYDPLSQIFKVMLLLAGAVTCLMALGDKGVGDKGEFYLIVIVATLGGLMMSSDHALRFQLALWLRRHDQSGRHCGCHERRIRRGVGRRYGGFGHGGGWLWL